MSAPRQAKEKEETGMSSGKSNDALAETIIKSLLRIINKIEHGRRVPRDYGAGVSMTLLEAEMCALIVQHAGVTGSELSEQLGVTRSATSQAVTKLKGKGLVIEEASDSDAKLKHLYLTQRGQDAAAIADDFNTKMKTELFGESRAELQAYLRFVTKLEAFHAGAVKDWRAG
jgi:DNA-binding MarR family transcriptional regulator